MVWKQVVNADSGTVDLFGGDDTDKIAKAFSGVDVDDINMNCDFWFYTSKGGFWNPGLTFKYLIATSAIAANRTLTLPLLTANDTFAFAGFNNNFTAKQTINLDTGGALLELYRPNNTVGNGSRLDLQLRDSANNQQTYARLTGKILANTSGAEEGYLGLDVVAGGSIVPVCDFYNGGFLDMYMGTNALDWESGLTMYGRDSDNNEDVAYGFYYVGIDDNTDGSEDGYLIAGAKQNGADKVYLFADVGGFRIGENANRVRLSDAGLSATRLITFPNVDTKLAGLAVNNIFTNVQRIEVTAANYRAIELYQTDNPATPFNGPLISMRGKNSSGTEVIYGYCGIQATSNVSGAHTGSFAVQTYDNSVFHDIIYSEYGYGTDFYTGSNYAMNLTRLVNGNGADCHLSYVMGNSVGPNNFVAYGRRGVEILDQTNGSEDGVLVEYAMVGGSEKLLTYIRGDSLQFSCGSAGNAYFADLSCNLLSAERAFSFPDASTTLAGYAVQGLFTENQTIKKNTTTLLSLYRDAYGPTQINLDFKNASNAQITGAYISSDPFDNTAGSEDAGLLAKVISNGAYVYGFYANASGFYCGTGLEINLTNAGLSGGRTYAFPNVTTTLAGQGFANLFTEVQTIKKDTQDLLKVYRDTSTTTNLVNILLEAKDSASNEQEYGRFSAFLQTTTNGAEDSFVSLWNIQAGTTKKRIEIDPNGTIYLADQLRVSFQSTGLTGIRLFTFPDLAGKVATCEFANIFTDSQTVKKNAAQLMTAFRDSATTNDEVYYSLDLKETGGTQRAAARLIGILKDPTNSSFDGSFALDCNINGTVTRVLESNADALGSLDIGSNRRFRITETDLSAQRTYKGPNADAVLEGAVVRNGTTLDINTTGTETDIINYSVGANALRANGKVKFEITGYLLQNQATGTTYTFILKFGGTNLISCVSPSVAQSATKLPFRIRGEVYNKNATNANAGSMDIICNDTTAITTGIGSIANDTTLFRGNSDSEGADTTKDTTSAQTLQVTVTMSVNNSAVHTVAKYREVELITSA